MEAAFCYRDKPPETADSNITLLLPTLNREENRNFLFRLLFGIRPWVVFQRFFRWITNFQPIQPESFVAAAGASIFAHTCPIRKQDANGNIIIPVCASGVTEQAFALYDFSNCYLFHCFPLLSFWRLFNVGSRQKPRVFIMQYFSLHLLKFVQHHFPAYIANCPFYTQPASQG